jgi:hypothetical protein
MTPIGHLYTFEPMLCLYVPSSANRCSCLCGKPSPAVDSPRGVGAVVAVSKTRVLYQRYYIPGMMRTAHLHTSRAAPLRMEAGKKYLMEMRHAEVGCLYSRVLNSVDPGWFRSQPFK